MITVEEHPLVVMVVILVGDLLLPVCVPLPQLLIHHFLDLQRRKNACLRDRDHDDGEQIKPDPVHTLMML